MPISRDIEYCVSGSGSFTVEVMDGNTGVYGVVVNIGYVKLPKFSKDCQLHLVGRDWSYFTIYVSDSKMIGE